MPLIAACTFTAATPLGTRFTQAFELQISEPNPLADSECALGIHHNRGSDAFAPRHCATVAHVVDFHFG